MDDAGKQPDEQIGIGRIAEDQAAKDPRGGSLPDRRACISPSTEWLALKAVVRQRGFDAGLAEERSFGGLADST